MTEITTTAGVTAVVVILTTLILVIATKLFSRSFSQDSNGGVVPNVIPDTSTSSPPTCRSCKYDVFISFRGEDTRNTFVGHLYAALQRSGIVAYKDDVNLERGDTIDAALLSAICESHIALIIFSENYADSSWCLDELSHIMKCKEDSGQIVIPIFYKVDPSDVRKQKGKFGKGFFKLSKIKKNRVESWKKALVGTSNIAGLEPKQIANGHEPTFIQEIVDDILKKLSSFRSAVDENLVGIESRLESLKSHLRIGSDDKRMVGIWGLGGAGKTTLATSLFKECSPNFDGCCFLGNIREASKQHDGLKSLQEKILLDVFGRQIPVQSDELGKDKIKQMLCRRKVLIVLDDVDHLEQLEALAGCREWFGDGSRIIITTRDQHLLTTHRVDEVYPISLLSREEAVRLLNKHAYNKNKPVEGYEVLSRQIVTYAAGLPLALIVLGSFLYDKDKDEWLSTLDRLKEHPEMDIVEKLKISYDGLKPVEKELFLDIACFHLWRIKNEAMEILDACGFYPAIGVQVLIQKALITVSEYGKFHMHDLVQEMAHCIVRGEHPGNPETYSRVWEKKDIKDLCSNNEIMENDKIEAIRCSDVGGGSFNNFINVISNMKKLRFLDVTTTGLCLDRNGYPASPFPESFQPRKMCFFKMSGSFQKELWKGYKHLPCLKVMELSYMNALVRTPDFGGLPSLQKLILCQCDSLEEIHQSLGSLSSLVHLSVRSCNKLTRFPKIVKMEKLKILRIEICEELTEFPDIEANMDSLVELTLRGLGKEILFPIIRKCSYRLNGLGLRKLSLNWCHLKDGDIPNEIGGLSNLRELHVIWNDFTRLDFSLSRLTSLKVLNLSCCRNLVELPELPSSLAILKADYCDSLEVIKDDAYRRCKWLREVSIWGGRKNINGGERLLESMLQGKGDKSRCMLLMLNDREIQKRFEPPLVIGRTCRMQFPENWSNHFSGFLLCYTSLQFMDGPTIINMKHVEKLVGGSLLGLHDVYFPCLDGDDDDDDDLDGETDDDDDVYFPCSLLGLTWVTYVPFSLLRHTSWWDPTSIAVEVEYNDGAIRKCGLKLVPKGAAAECSSSETTCSSSGDDDYNPKFHILHDSKSACKFQLYHFRDSIYL